MLSVSKTYKGLGVTMKVGSFEALDLISCLILAGVSSIIFGQSEIAPLFIVILPALALFTLYLAKRGKPDGYLRHLLKYHLTPGHYAAACHPDDEHKMRRRII